MSLKITKEYKEQIVVNIQRYFLEERGEEIGNLAAEFLMDFMIQQIGPHIYNQAVGDAQTLLMQRMASLDEDVSALRMPIKLGYK